MKKRMGILFLVMSFFSIVFLVGFSKEHVEIVKGVIWILVLLILEVLLALFKKERLWMKLLEGIFIGVSVVLKVRAVIYLIPIIIFRAFSKVDIGWSIACSVGILFFFKDVDYFNLVIYIAIVNLYLNEVRKSEGKKRELIETNRSKSNKDFKMRETIDDLEKYLEQNTIIAGLKERNFMAQKLHDHLGHRITSSLMQLEVTKEVLDSDKELGRKYLITAMENLRVGMDEIRHVLKGVKPREQTLGIEEIREQLLKFKYTSRIKTSLEIKGDLEKIKLNYWMIIEENLREALTNIGKYSKADLVIVSILVYNKILRVEIRDNGSKVSLKEEGLGLKGMRERVEKVSGRLEYFNDNGFVINMIFKI